MISTVVWGFEVIKMRVRQHDEANFPRVEGEWRLVVEAGIPRALEYPAVDEKTPRAALEKKTRVRDLTGRTAEGDLHTPASAM